MLILPLEDTQIRYLVIDADNRAYRYYLSEIVENYHFAYLRFSGEKIEVEDASHQISSQYLSDNDMAQFTILVLDECDRLTQHSYEDLFELLDNLWFSKVVLFTRKPISILQEMANNSAIRYISTNESQALDSFDKQMPVLRVNAFGVGQAWLNGSEIDFSTYPLLHEFFFYTLAQGAVLRTDAIDEFWSEFNHKSAVSNFHVTRKNLDYLFGVEFLTYLGTHYELNPNIVLQYDVADYLHRLDDMSYDNSEVTDTTYREVYSLYQGDFLMSLKSEWVITLRDKLRKQQSEVCFVLGKAEHSPEQALGYYSQAFRLNPYREDIAEAMMLIYLERDLPCDALDVYNTLSHNLLNSSGIKPKETIKELTEQARVNC